MSVRVSRSFISSGIGIPNFSSTGRVQQWSDRLGKRCFTSAELNRMQMCCPCPGDNYAPTCICIQQTPVVISKKNIIWVQKVHQEPSVVNTTKTVMVPKVIKVARAVRIPEVTWTEGVVKAPKIEYRKSNITTYDVRQCGKNIMAPQEICTMYTCRPKPQYILVPPPTDYCCYPIDVLNQLESCQLKRQCPQVQSNSGYGFQNSFPPMQSSMLGGCGMAQNASPNISRFPFRSSFEMRNPLFNNPFYRPNMTYPGFYGRGLY